MGSKARSNASPQFPQLRKEMEEGFRTLDVVSVADTIDRLIAEMRLNGNILARYRAISEVLPYRIPKELQKWHWNAAKVTALKSLMLERSL